MKADFVIMDGMMLDAITSENKELRNRNSYLESLIEVSDDSFKKMKDAYDIIKNKIAIAKEMHKDAELKSSMYAERIRELHKKMESKVAECVELAQKCCYYDKLVDELIKENNALHDQIKKQEEREESIWEWISNNLPAPWDLDYDDMEEFN